MVFGLCWFMGNRQVNAKDGRFAGERPTHSLTHSHTEMYRSERFWKIADNRIGEKRTEWMNGSRCVMIEDCSCTLCIVHTVPGSCMVLMVYQYVTFMEIVTFRYFVTRSTSALCWASWERNRGRERERVSERRRERIDRRIIKWKQLFVSAFYWSVCVVCANCSGG